MKIMILISTMLSLQVTSDYKPGYEYIRVMDSGKVEYWKLIEWVEMPELQPEGGRWRAQASWDQVIWADCWTDNYWIDEGAPSLEEAIEKYKKRKANNFNRNGD